MKLKYHLSNWHFLVIFFFILSILSISGQSQTQTIFEAKEQYLDYHGVQHDFNAQNLAQYPMYLSTEDQTNRYFKIESSTISLPKSLDVTLQTNRISPSMTFPKSLLVSRMINYNATVGYLVFPYSLSRVKDWSDDHNIKFGRWHWDNSITITGENDTNLSSEYYDFKIVNDEMRLYFNKAEANKLQGNITFQMNSWTIGNATFWSTQDCGTGYWSAFGGGSCGTPLNSSIHANLSGYWDMESTTGNTEYGINKYSTNGFPNSSIVGMWNGNTTLNYTSSQNWGNAVYFDGINDYLNIGNDPILNIINKLVIHSLINTSSNVLGQHIIGGYNSTSPYDGYGFWISTSIPSTGKMGYWNGTAPWKNANTAINNGQWHNIGLNVSGTAFTFYNNDVSDGSYLTGGNNTAYTGLRAIGSRSDGVGFFNGSIDEVIISSGNPIFSNSTYSTYWNMSILNNSGVGIINAVKFNISNINIQGNHANISMRENNTIPWTLISQNYVTDTWINQSMFITTDFLIEVYGNGSSRAFIINAVIDEETQASASYNIVGYVNNTLGAFVDGAKVTINGATTLSRETYIKNLNDLCDFNHTSGLCNGNRQSGTNYTTSTPIQLFVYAHANNVSHTAEIILNIDGTNISYTSGRPLGGAEESYKQIIVDIPAYTQYKVYFINYHHFAWFEWEKVHGYYNLTSLNGSQSVLAQQIGYDSFSSTLNVNGNLTYNITLQEKDWMNDIITYSMVGAILGGLLAYLLLRRKRKLFKQ